jgi:pyridinium-3,5-biscarboxylic acid mononucleotide synthase
MTLDRIRRLLEDVQKGRLGVEAAVRHLKTLPYEDIGFAAVDHHRLFRQGMAETILCEGKTQAQVLAIATRLRRHRHPVLATRVDPGIGRALLRLDRGAQHDPIGRTVVLDPPKGWSGKARRAGGEVLIITAGTSDISVAEEARATAQILGNTVTTMYDVGVAGLHRLLDRHRDLESAHVLIVIAGMDGALPSVVGGLVSQPVVAVPTSRGYGANFGGVSALLAMLNSCASGIGVVNIDNGFGAACLAHRINQTVRSAVVPSPRKSRVSSTR